MDNRHRSPSIMTVLLVFVFLILDFLTGLPVAADPCDPAPPVIAPPACGTVETGAAFVCDVDATGCPEPVFSLDSAPFGMTIDAITGEITWQAGSPGTHPVVVSAGNTEGVDSLTFDVEVLPVPDPVTYHVDPVVGSDDNEGTPGLPFRTIQGGINRAMDGDTIVLADGVYQGDLNRDLDFGGRLITLKSASGIPENCIIDAGSTPVALHHGFWFHSGEDSNAVVQDIRVINADRAVLVGAPGGNSIDPAAPRFQNCDFMFSGVGIEVLDYDSSVWLDGCAVAENDTGVIISEDGMGNGGRFYDCDIFSNAGPGIFTIDAFSLHIALEVVDSRIYGNEVAGIFHGAAFGSVFLIDSDVYDNRGWGVHARGDEAGSLWVRGGDFYLNDAGGIFSSSWTSTFSGAEVYDNRGPGIACIWTSNQSFEDCRIYSNDGDGINTSTWFSKARLEPQNHYYEFEDCQIYDNGGVGLVIPGFPPFGLAVRGFSVVNNTGGGVLMTATKYEGFDYSLLFEGCTIARNPYGVRLEGDVPVDIHRSLIAENTGPAVECLTAEVPMVTCSNIYGNTGDWVGCISGQDSDPGNFSADPLFCAITDGEPFVMPDSPCLPGGHPNGEDCGLIGSYGCCMTLEPLLTSVEDVGNDQGRYVRLIWEGSDYDAEGSPVVITGYGVYRRQDNYKDAGWDFVETVPARGVSIYQYVAPTLCDSTVFDGPCESLFMVSAMTSDPLVYYDSLPLAGYSLDNLPPGDPTNLSVEVGETGRMVSWDASPAADLHSYLVFRGTSTSYRLDDTNQVARVFDRFWLDDPTPDDPLGLEVVYTVAAQDSAGNLSPGLTLGGISSSINGHRFAHLGNRPNPFNPATDIAFSLPRTLEVTVSIYDLRGRMVRVLVDGESHSAGFHEIPWDGRDSGGRELPSGVYFSRVQAGALSQTARMALLK